MATVFTIGYEGIDIDVFVALLGEHGVETIVDVRELPLSRKPGFSKKTLANILNLSGFEYQHMSELGCPKPVRDQYREDGNWSRYTKGYLEYLGTQQEAVQELADLVETTNCALLCYEADFNFCHRSFVAKAVQECSGASVEHISLTVAKTTHTAEKASRQAAFA